MQAFSANNSIPIPPIELRRTVGVEDVAFFDNPHHVLIFGDAVSPELYKRFFDFGCGCGRIARQLMLQSSNIPDHYFGIDLYRPSVEWCAKNLTLANENFSFQHHDFYNAGLNPSGSKSNIKFPSVGTFSLLNAHSVFTHIIEDHVKFYFEQAASIVMEGGVTRISWFLFNKALFPMMQEFQNSLYINTDDPTNAVIYDIDFVKSLYRLAGLSIYRIDAPGIRGHQWLIYARKGESDVECEFPEDLGVIGLARPPVTIGGSE